MFSKKVHTDVKKSALKITDLKKDVVTRYKHLRNVLEHVDGKELKTFFECNYSNIYHLFYENFIIIENSLRQRELPFAIVHKAHREELEAILLVLDRILTLCPELICNRWQCYSLTYIISKLLHPGNSWRLRREAIKYFILWYQALGEDAPDNIHAMYATLVPGFPSPFEAHPGIPGLTRPPATGSVFHGSPIGPVEISVMYPPPSGEKQPDDEMRYFLDALLEFMVTQVPRIRWSDSWPDRHHRCFIFLFESFKKYYLPLIFPEYSRLTNIYKPVLEMPQLRSSIKTDRYISCRVCVIKWVASFTYDVKQKEMPLTSASQYFPQRPPPFTGSYDSGGIDYLSNQARTASPSIPDDGSSPSNSIQNTEDPLSISFQIVRDVLYSCRENVNFIHEIYRQSFMLNFNYSPAIRRTIAVYKDWIQMSSSEIPPFMLEPLENEQNPSLENTENSNDNAGYMKPLRLRNDSYVGAILKENIFIRAGLQNLLQLFITHAANVFLLEVDGEFTVLLEEQVDTCKRVLNMYRYMVMHTNMETKTWEQLLIILLKITSSMLSKIPPNRKEDTLGGRLAPAIFQTLIVTWIKANLNIVVSSELWDQFLEVLSSLTEWEELIREWAKTMETLTRVLARHVYKLDLLDLPLDRLTEQKAKRRRAMTGVTRKRTEFADTSFKMIQSSMVTESGDSEVSREEPEKQETKWSARMTRSLSDTNINYLYRTRNFVKQEHYSIDSESEIMINNDLRYERKVSFRRKWRSVDSLKKYSHADEYDSQPHSRCASPSPSSGMECNSVKDAPIQIDVISVEQPSLDASADEERRSVMAGGTVRGWLPDVAVVLWKRMLAALGNVNQISDANLHAQVFLHLTELANTLIKLYLNQGVSADNQITIPMPELIPPITYTASWCFQTLKLPHSYQRGKLYAYKLLCQTTIAAPNCVLSPIYINMFLKVLRDGLISSDKNVVYTVVKYTGPRFFSRQLPGYTTLIPEFIQATNVVLASDDLGLTPRPESVGILASLLSLVDVVAEFPLFQKTENLPATMKNRILKLLIHAAKKEQSGLARGTALSSLGIFLLQETISENKHGNYKEAFNMLLLALKFNHDVIAQISCDVLMLLCEHAEAITKMYPELPLRTVEVIANTLGSMIPIEDNKKRLLTSLVFLLAEWAMKIPVVVLKQKRSSNSSLISSVFKVLDELSNSTNAKPVNVGGHFNPDLVKEFITSITVDNLKHDQTDRSLFDSSPMPAHLNNIKQSIQIAARMITAHLMENIGQFPLSAGPSTLSSLVTEQDDVPGLSTSPDQLNTDIFTQPNIQVFATMNNMIISFIELPSLENPGFDVPKSYITTPSCARIILRTLNGKYCWDATALQPDPEANDEDCSRVYLDKNIRLDKKEEEIPYSSYMPSDVPQMMRHRHPDVLPTCENSAADLDNVDDLLQYMSHTSPEVLEDPDRLLNTPSNNSSIPVEMEQQMISAILNQKYQEQEYLKQHADILAPKSAQCQKKGDFDSDSTFSNFRLCRLFMSHFGFFSWEYRKYVYLLQKNEKVLRELRNLDSQPCRETHKIAIIYVGTGQEDKTSILSNTGGSQNYENFIAALAWEVELETHAGFMGGLQRNKSTGVTAPYYATSLLEVIFHVSTRMPSTTQEASINKTRHLGNDEVHIVWSEHYRDYRRGIIPTDFCDVLIVIYPLPLGLFRLQISRKSEVPFFGPLFTELVVEWRILPNLVRTIAISASRAKRSMLPFYQQYYEERFRLLETIVRNYKLNTTYEEFVAQCFAPSNTSFSEKYGKSLGLRNMGVSIDSSFQSSQHGQLSSSLASALIDTTRSIETDSCHSWPSSSGGSMDTDMPIGISPRPFKKISSKGNSRRSVIPSLTPPDSPTARKFK